MKRCRVCSAAPIIELRQHNSAFCAEHLISFVHRQVERCIKKFDMFEPDARILVAVSGGKDSLALWDILHTLGYETEGLLIGLGIGEYSMNSANFARTFAAERDLKLIEVDLASDHGFTVPEAAERTRRVPCSACGLSKRHIFDSTAIDGGFDVVVTGHNLDDEAAVLFGNVARWQSDYLGRQRPVLAATNGFPRKAKPLVRLSEREMAAYCVVRGIDYVVEECPMSAGNKHLAFKGILNQMEVESPGAKHAFYFGFLERAAERFEFDLDGTDDESGDSENGIGRCSECGSPSNGEVCAFCRLVAQVRPPTEVAIDTPSRDSIPTGEEV